ncbi:hypothetical protein GOP47_0019130 [Adiantum capillus-veneris]|uniref:Uncharacterized protein n=1 Tax=Adiantum capillus-veneris TaxID=13818 RepID=A0A9D4ZBC5_ADICA|nr:hypothetical protein GOP47_0019130 [Adiantum capillus-veneris]
MATHLRPSFATYTQWVAALSPIAAHHGTSLAHSADLARSMATHPRPVPCSFQPYLAFQSYLHVRTMKAILVGGPPIMQILLRLARPPAALDPLLAALSRPPHSLSALDQPTCAIP